MLPRGSVNINDGIDVSAKGTIDCTKIDKVAGCVLPFSFAYLLPILFFSMYM